MVCAVGCGRACSGRWRSRLNIDRAVWHRYDVYWLRERVVWGVDGHVVHAADVSPRGPLGLVIWIDNQWARVTPAGSFGAGLLANAAPQWLEYRDLRITVPEAPT